MSGNAGQVVSDVPMRRASLQILDTRRARGWRDGRRERRVCSSMALVMRRRPAREDPLDAGRAVTCTPVRRRSDRSMRASSCPFQGTLIEVVAVDPSAAGVESHTGTLIFRGTRGPGLMLTMAMGWLRTRRCLVSVTGAAEALARVYLSGHRCFSLRFISPWVSGWGDGLRGWGDVNEKTPCLPFGLLTRWDALSRGNAPTSISATWRPRWSRQLRCRPRAAARPRLGQGPLAGEPGR